MHYILKNQEGCIELLFSNSLNVKRLIRLLKQGILNINSL